MQNIPVSEPMVDSELPISGVTDSGQIYAIV